MASNTRARSAALQVAARAFVEARGVDITETVPINALAPAFAAEQACHLDTAKRHLGKAVRRMRGDLVPTPGGARPGAGRPRKDTMD